MNTFPEQVRTFNRQILQTYPYTAGLYKVDLSGKLPFLWSELLTQVLYERKINILSGFARRVSTSQWTGEFIVDPLGSPVDISELDLGRLVFRAKYRAGNPELCINRFLVRQCFKTNGSVYLEIEGVDQIGFLAGLLKKFRACGLFFWDFSIATENNCIYDKFYLMGPGGIDVSTKIMRVLEIKLNGMPA